MFMKVAKESLKKKRKAIHTNIYIHTVKYITGSHIL